MTRKLTTPELRARVDHLEREQTLLLLALQITAGDEPSVEQAIVNDQVDKRARTIFRLYRPDAPHGGIVIARFHAPGQRDTYTVYYLDELNDRFPRDLDYAVAFDKLRATARRVTLIGAEQRVWQEYDSAAEYCAVRRDLEGARLPELISRAALQLIYDDPEAFAARIKATAYARAMAPIDARQEQEPQP